MNWSFLLFAFSLAVVTGAVAVTTLARMRPEWTARKQGLVAALILPAIALAAMIVGVVNLLLSGDIDDGMRDLALAAIVQGGLISMVIGFVGGLLGVFLRQKGRQR